MSGSRLSYFLVGGDSDDLIQEGLLGLVKAIRDYRTDRESSFRNFAELCITRQIITAVKTATRNKHVPLNQYVSFGQSPASNTESETTMEEILPGPTALDPVNQAISSEELSSLVSCLQSTLSEMESSVLGYYLEDRSSRGRRRPLGCETKTVDNALQRVKRKGQQAPRITRHRRLNKRHWPDRPSPRAGPHLAGPKPAGAVRITPPARLAQLARAPVL